MKQALRVVFVNHTGKVSGAEKILLHMIAGLDREIYEPRLVCATDGPLAEVASSQGVPCQTVAPLQARFTKRPDMLMRYGFSIIGSVMNLRSCIKQNAPDIIHCNTVRAGIVTTIATLGMKAPVIWHVHDILPDHPITSVIRRLAKYSKRTHAIGVSVATARAFAGRLDFGDRVSVIHNGIDLSRFPRRWQKEEHLSIELGISPSDFLVATVGQIAPRKNLSGLISAFARVLQNTSNAHLAIVGDAIFNEDFKYRDGLIAQAEELNIADRIHFTGARKDIDRVMRSSDLIVLNSLEEPFGLVLVEAMSSGTPVLASAVGGVPEIVTDNVTGFLVNSDDEAGLTAKIMELMSNPARMEEVAERALIDVCPRHSLNKFLEDLHAYYRQLMRRSVGLADTVDSQRRIEEPRHP